MAAEVVACTAAERRLLEAAAELDPDTYVPVLDLLDEGLEDREEEPLEQWLTSGAVPVREQCPLCGHREFHDEWIL